MTSSPDNIPASRPDYAELRRLAEAATNEKGFGQYHHWAYIAAANPQAVLALLDERDRLRGASARLLDWIAGQPPENVHGWGLHAAVERVRAVLAVIEPRP